MFTWQEHLIIELQPVSCYCEFVVMSTAPWGKGGESERGRDLPFLVEDGEREPWVEFLPFKELVHARLNRKVLCPSLPWASLSGPLLMSCFSPYILPYTLGFDLCLWSTGLCSPMMAPTMGPAHSINAYWKTKLPKVDVLENGPINHKWSTSDTAVMVKAGLCGRGRLEDEAAKIEKKEAFSYFVELFLIIRIIHSEFPVS